MGAHLTMAYRLLNSIPLDITVIALIVLCVAILIPGREYFEGGLGYNVCFSSQLGDIALIGIISTGVRIIQCGCEVPAFLNSLGYQWFCIGAAVLTAAVWESAVAVMAVFSGSKDPWGTAMDVYHNVFIGPLLVFLLLLTLPLVYCRGDLSQKIWVLFLFLTWVGLLLFDGKTGRLDQPDWLKKNGFGFILKK